MVWPLRVRDLEPGCCVAGVNMLLFAGLERCVVTAQHDRRGSGWPQFDRYMVRAIRGLPDAGPHLVCQRHLPVLMPSTIGTALALMANLGGQRGASLIKSAN